MEKELKKLKVVSVTPLTEGQEVILHDLQISASNDAGVISMIDMEIIETTKHNEGYCIKPGVWRITPKSGLQPLELPDETYFETDTYRELTRRFDAFRAKLVPVYEHLGLLKKRAILLGSDPGVGKSSLLRQFNRKIRTMSDMCVLVIDSEDVDWETVITMFIKSSAEDAAFVVLVMEDIGGASLHERNASIPSTLLNFLDGTTDCFKIPTLIVATTNFLNEIGGQLIDRPGRFDIVLQVDPPKDGEIQFLMESFLKRELTDEEQTALLGHRFTPAYAREALVRSLVEDTPIKQAVKSVLEQRDRAEKKNHGSKNRHGVGFGKDNFEVL